MAARRLPADRRSGKLTLNRNVTDYHTEMEQAAFEPNNLVAGTGLSPDKMLLARGFSYADAHRARLGVNYKQIPVNPPKVPVHSYSKDGAMRVQNVSDPVYAPNSYGGPKAAAGAAPTTAAPGTPTARWCAPRTRCAPRTTTGARPARWSARCSTTPPAHRLVDNIVGHLLNGVSEPILLRAFEYWRNVDKDLGDRIEAGVRAKQDEKDPKAAEQANPARESAQDKA